MCLTGKKRFAVLFAGILAGTITLTSVYAATEKDSSNNGSTSVGSTSYISTNRDTRLPEESIEIKEQSVADYEKLYETESAIYYFRDDRDIIAVYDKESGYLWKTGLDSGIGKDLKKLARNAETEEELAYLERNPIEENLNEVYAYFANSLVSIEYKKEGSVESSKKASSSDGDSVSELSKLDDNKYCLSVDFAAAAVQLKMYITFGEKEITYDIPYEEITGEGKAYLYELYITPFLGSSGGEVTIFNREKGKYDETVKKDTPSGYVFLPDGSGALVRFRDNAVSFQTYVGDVYGADVSQGEYYHRELTDAVALKEPVMPVFGVAYGNNQVAFVAYAEQGDEYMSICLTPEENITYYTWVTPKFSYNTKYHQVYNKAGSGFFTLLKEARNFDITMTYEFLTGDGSGSTEAANYSGMALAYRNHLLEKGILTEQAVEEQSALPLRLDFIMSDSESSIVGTKNVVVTTAEDVRTILEDVMENGITNINSGLYGWQKKGVSIAKPYTQKFSSAIGTKAQFKKLFEDFAAMQVDISYGQDYVTINELMMNYYQNAVRHMSSWYVEENRESLLPDSVPTAIFGYAAPNKSAEWLLTQFEAVKDYSASMTVQGIGSVLTGNYISKDEIITVSDTMELYQETLSVIGEEVQLNVENPHKYLWQYVDRYLQAPVGHSQYIFETDAVPFLQMVLYGTMEVYGPYSNFSFYTQKDILKMIDYNIAPSFILSMEPSYKLADTVSCDLYSTEYSLYEDLIQAVYGQVNQVWKQISGYNWVSRTVVADGVIVNTYEQNGLVKEVVINYTLNDVTYQNVTVGAESALVLE
ncbi:MAG: hypothetical protein J6B85_04630 [Lachnospiraceae bacterium]|nr:hypothetical protein [Lachnospiraceae bacterium]